MTLMMRDTARSTITWRRGLTGNMYADDYLIGRQANPLSYRLWLTTGEGYDQITWSTSLEKVIEVAEAHAAGNLFVKFSSIHNDREKNARINKRYEEVNGC